MPKKKRFFKKKTILGTKSRKRRHFDENPILGIVVRVGKVTMDRRDRRAWWTPSMSLSPFQMTPESRKRETPMGNNKYELTACNWRERRERERERETIAIEEEGIDRLEEISGAVRRERCVAVIGLAAALVSFNFSSSRHRHGNWDWVLSTILFRCVI